MSYEWGRAAEAAPKSLVLVSDMLENEPDYSQYGGDQGRIMRH